MAIPVTIDPHPDPYDVTWRGGRLDPYRIAELYQIRSHPQFHALKKVLCAGQRGAKTYRQDILEAIGALHRLLSILDEDAAPIPEP